MEDNRLEFLGQHQRRLPAPPAGGSIMSSGTASGQAKPGGSLCLEQALAPEQALPLGLESSGALGVDLEQE